MPNSIKIAVLLLVSGPLLLTGCSMGTVTSSSVPDPVQVPESKVAGIVTAGQQPVANASLQLYAVGNSGYGSSATPLFTAGPVLTTANGNFTLPAFTCPAASSLVYMTATGGQPSSASQNGAAVTNNNLAMMVGLGPCGDATAQFITVNELTTVASVWALAQFMSGPANIGSSPTNLQGITNAFAAINKLVDTATGTLPGPMLPSNATLPTEEINTLAGILHQCISSGGGSAANSTDGLTTGNSCDKLFYLTGGASTTDTITAAMNIAHNPAANVAKLNALRSATSAVFQPALDASTSPTDWTLAINYTGGGLSSPHGIAADQVGNVWVANPGNSSVSEFSNAGVAQSPATGFTAGGINAPYALAVDQSGYVWIANSGNNTLTRLTSGASGTSYSGNGLSAPTGVAIDSTGNVFVSNTGASTVSAFSSSGTPLTGSPFTTTGATNAVAISPR